MFGSGRAAACDSVRCSHYRCNQIPLSKMRRFENASRYCRLSIIATARKGHWLVFLCVFVHCFIFQSLCRLVVLMRAVRQTVPSQVTVAPKHLSAAATAVGLDVCMGEKVSFQVTSLIKGSSACGAFVGRFLFRFKASKGLFALILYMKNCIFVFLNHLD